MTKTAAAVALVLCGTAAHADDSQFTKFGNTDKAVFSFKNGSFTVAADKNGAPSLALLIQQQDNDGTVSYYIVMTEVATCRQGFGTVMLGNLSGDQHTNLDVVAGGSSVASSEFDLLCGMYKLALSRTSSASDTGI